jgi:hypothetical protein
MLECISSLKILMFVSRMQSVRPRYTGTKPMIFRSITCNKLRAGPWRSGAAFLPVQGAGGGPTLPLPAHHQREDEPLHHAGVHQGGRDL